MINEAEAWIRGKRRMVHNQSLIQFFAILAIIIPLPDVASVFWVTFGLGCAIAIQIILGLWASVAVIYSTSVVCIRIRQRKP